MKKSILLFSSIVLFISLSFAQNTEEPLPAKNSYISFKSVVYDFGTLEYGAEASGEYIFKNISKETVKLTNVKASCGCTGTEWPREEIKKGKKGTIAVTYDTKRVGKFHKTIYVYVDKAENPIQLQIKGTVLPKEGVTEQPKTSSVKNTKAVDSPEKVKIDASPKQTKADASKSKDFQKHEIEIKNTTEPEEKEETSVEEPVKKELTEKEIKIKSETKVKTN